MQRTEDLVKQLVEITHCSPADANALLAACGWDLEAAVSLFFSREQTEGSSAGGGDGELLQPLLPDAQPSRPRIGSGSHEQSTAVRQATTEAPPSGSVLRRAMQKLISALWEFVRCLFSPFGYLFSRGSGASTASFRSFYETRFGETHPEFFQGTITQANTAAFRGSLPLAIYLHSEDDRTVDTFCRTALNDSLTCSLLRENFVLWGDHSRNLRQQTIRSMLNPHRYPYFAVLLPGPSTTDCIKIRAVEGECTQQQLVSILTEAIERCETLRNSLLASSSPSPGNRHANDRLLREQQDREYQEALRIDAARSASQESAAREAAKSEKEDAEMKRRLESERKELVSRFRAEAEADATSPPDASKLTRICVRMPNGQKVERSFRKSDKLRRIFEWIKCADLLDESLNLNVPRAFTLAIPMSTRKVDAESMEDSLEQWSLIPSAMLLLLEVEED